MKFFGREADIWKEIHALKAVCFTHKNVMVGGNGSYMGTVETIGLDTRVKAIEEKLDMILDYLKLEEHQPDCKKVLRLKKESNND